MSSKSEATLSATSGALFSILFALLVVPGIASPAAVQRQPLAPEIEAFVQEMAQKHQFDAAALRGLFAGLEPRAAILRAVAAPSTARPWHEFRARIIDPKRIRDGIRYWREHRDTLQRVSREYGVPEDIIVATIGIETLYGRHTGTYRVLEALTTLAFHYPPRARLFRSELESFLLLTREAGLDVRRLRGSYAGAIGIPQFLPSSYRRYAVDFDGDGERNLDRMPDAIASVANYYRAHGWQDGAAVLVPVEESGAAVEELLGAGVKPSFRVSELVGQGWRPAAPADGTALAAVIRAQTEAGPAYWLAFNNFYVITRYNRSVNYALAVHELAQALRAAVGSGG